MKNNAIKLFVMAATLCVWQANAALGRGGDDGYHKGHKVKEVHVYHHDDDRVKYVVVNDRPKHWHKHKEIYVVKERNIPYRVVNAYPTYNSYPSVQVNCVPNRPILGTVIGGVAGGLIGNQFGKGDGKIYTTIGGTVLGSVIGNTIATADNGCATQVLEYAKPGTQVHWKNPDNGYSYTVLPTRNFQNPEGRYCREYHSISTIGSQQQETYGTACRQPDGAWEVISN